MSETSSTGALRLKANQRYAGVPTRIPLSGPIRAEAVALILVCRVIRHSRIERRIADRLPSPITLFGRMTERLARGVEASSRA